MLSWRRCARLGEAVRVDVMADDRDARIAQLEIENASLREREGAAVERATRAESALAESLEQQTATAEVLRVVAAFPTDLQRVLDMVAQRAMVLSGSRASVLRTRQDDILRIVSTAGDVRLTPR